MNAPSHHRPSLSNRYAFWLALVAIMLASLMPTVSRVLAAQPGALVGIDICSSSRSVDNPGTAQTPAGGEGLRLSLDDCGYCLLMADRLGPTLALAIPPLALAAHLRPLPPLPWHTFRPDLRLAQPRGPPSLSALLA